MIIFILQKLHGCHADLVPLLVDLYTILRFSREKVIIIGKKYVCNDMHYMDGQTNSKIQDFLYELHLPIAHSHG